MSRSKAPSKTRARGPKRPDPKILSGTRPFLAGRNLSAALCILLAVVTIALYSPAIGHSFVILDDREYVTTNAHIRGLGWDNIK